MEEYPSKQVTENLDDPPNSRLFVVTSRSITEDELRESFSVFGDIQGVWVVKDKQTKESKGICYVKFAKSSQACMAMEEMHGKVVMEGTKPIKVTLTVRPQGCWVSLQNICSLTFIFSNCKTVESPLASMLHMGR